MSITTRHVTQTFGKLPSGARLPTPAAHLVAQTLHTCMPELSPAAARVCAQHLHHVSKRHPRRGAAEVISTMAKDLGVHPQPYHGPAAMHAAVHGNHPLPAFLAEARRLTHHEKKKETAAHKRADYARGGIEEDLREAIEKHGKKELEEIKRDLAIAGALEGGAREGGGIFSNIHRGLLAEAAKAKKESPIRYHIMRKLLGGAGEGGGLIEGGGLMEGGCLTGGAYEGGAKHVRFARPHEGVGFAEEDVEYALKKHPHAKHVKMTPAEKKQMMRDLEKYGVGEPGPRRAAHKKSAIRKGTLYDAFR